MTADEDLRALSDDYREKGWMIGRRERVFYAWYPPVPRSENGLMVLHDATVPGLRARIEVFEEVFAATCSRAEAEQAAEDLET